MGKRSRGDQAAQRLSEVATAERRLLKRERRAERELAVILDALRDDEARLARAQDRVDRRRAELAVAADRLRQRQADRARGPEFRTAPPAAEPRSEVAPAS